MGEDRESKDAQIFTKVINLDDNGEFAQSDLDNE